VGFWIVCWFSFQGLCFARGQFYLQRLGDSSRDLTLNSSDVSQLAVVLSAQT
jgi:hypothetical protein